MIRIVIAVRGALIAVENSILIRPQLTSLLVFSRSDLDLLVQLFFGLKSIVDPIAVRDYDVPPRVPTKEGADVKLAFAQRVYYDYHLIIITDAGCGKTIQTTEQKQGSRCFRRKKSTSL